MSQHHISDNDNDGANLMEALEAVEADETERAGEAVDSKLREEAQGTEETEVRLKCNIWK